LGEYFINVFCQFSYQRFRNEGIGTIVQLSVWKLEFIHFKPDDGAIGKIGEEGTYWL